MPGIVLLLSTFYKRHVVQFRFALIYCFASLSAAFSGLLAFAIQHLNGKHGITSWQWIFIIVRHFLPSLFSSILDQFTQEGVFSSAFGLAAFYFVPASPRSIRLLTEEEREAYCRDLADDRSGDADMDGKYNEVFRWSEVASVFTDAPHVLVMCLTLFLNGVTVNFLYSFQRIY